MSWKSSRRWDFELVDERRTTRTFQGSCFVLPTEVFQFDDSKSMDARKAQPLAINDGHVRSLACRTPHEGGHANNCRFP